MRGTAIFVVFLFLSISGIALSFARLDSADLRSAEWHSFVGFDRNHYPGDEALPNLRKSFSFASYWLNPPPGEKNNSWIGKRGLMQAQGFGFLLLYEGRTSGQLPYKKDSIEAGLADAQGAAAAARREGFPEGSVIFLDVEEGGRFFDGYHAYLRSWAESLTKEKFRPGIYCSGIVVDEGEGSTIISADDIRAHIGVPDIVYWVYNDACPPSPGCGAPQNPPAPAASGVAYASVWQYVRSPREKKVARHCRGYAGDGNCYAPGDMAHKWFLDENLATTADPSAGR
jgi:Rv2525c-like, glycoside hydrolase-like domain